MLKAVKQVYSVVHMKSKECSLTELLEFTQEWTNINVKACAEGSKVIVDIALKEHSRTF